MAWTPIRLLDTIATAPTGAWSTRKLRGAFSGSCLRVRRSSDNAETDIGFDVNGEMDKAAIRAYVGSGNDGFVVTWYDQSGNTRDVTQATAANQPQIVDNGALITTINRKSSPTFDGSNDKLASTATLDVFTNIDAYTALSISRPTAAGSDDANGHSRRAVLGDDGGIFWHGSYGTTKILFGHQDSGGVRDVTSLTFSTSTTYVLVGKYDGSTISGYRDGGSPGTVAATLDTLTPTTQVLQIGQCFSQFFIGSVLEVITFDSFLSVANTNILGADMASRAGVTWTNIS